MECLIISGMSGAGKSVAVDVLEDIGYYCIDNMPVKLIPQFLELFSSGGGKEKAAFVVDIRGGSDHSYLFRVVDDLIRQGTRCRILFLDCSDEVLINRQKASRRRHPLDVDGSGLEAAVSRERQLMEPVRARADFVIDTTALGVADFKTHLQNLFGAEGRGSAMMISVCTFGYKYGIPHESDLVFDVRFLKNPYYDPALRPRTGLDQAVYDYVFSDPNAPIFVDKLVGLLRFLIPLYLREGKTSLVIAVGCTGGRHRSVSVGRRLCQELQNAGWQVTLRHRDAEKG